MIIYSKDEIVKKINRDFIPILIDLSKTLTAEEETLGEKYDYQDDCLLLFLDHHSEVMPHKDGRDMCYAEKIEPQAFIEHLDYVLGSQAAASP